MPFIEHDGLAFHYHDRGQGVPFIFQHGLGGDVSQPAGVFTPPPGFRLLTLDCRAHGATRPLGDPAKIGITAFADDIRMLMEHLELSSAIVGGISMGAAVALNIALRFPDHVRGLVLSRPAWLDQPLPEHMQIFVVIAQLIRQHGAERGMERFKRSAAYRSIRRASPDAARSLVGQFQHPRAEETVVKLERIPQDAPNRNRAEWAAIRVPTLVLANRHDPIHPFDYGAILAAGIPGAICEEITAKSVSQERHAADVQALIATFLTRHFAQ